MIPAPSGVLPPLPRHGGALAWAEAQFGVPPHGWVDLSTGVNPWPYPLPPLPPAIAHRLPDDDLLHQACSLAARHAGAVGSSGVVAGAGSQALIASLPRLRPPAQVAVIGHAYAEHALSWRRAGHRVREIPSPEAVTEHDMVVVLINPNNPDGHSLLPADLFPLADRLAERGGWLVVDEAFADTRPEISLAPFTGRHPALWVLRSFGKFFGLAGLRLGFALTTPLLANTLREALGPWAVSGPALWAAGLALADQPWIVATRIRLREAAAVLDQDLQAAGLTVRGGTPLFRLASSPHAAALFVRAAQAGVLVRIFTEEARSHWLRFGLPADDDARARLQAVLAAAPA